MILKGIIAKYVEGIEMAKGGVSRAQLAELAEKDPLLANIVGKARLGTGNPTASAAGKCAAQMQMLRFPKLSKPEYIRPRAIMTFQNGDLIEEWWSSQVKLAYPGLAGLQQMVFYFPVPVTDEQVKELKNRIQARYGTPGAIWGKVQATFSPPYLKMGANGKPSFRRAANEMMGFVLETGKKILWVPGFIDEAIFHPELGITIIEKKAVSNFAFRKMVLGQIDYQKQCQLATIAEASGLNVALLAYRKDTAHLLEIAYVRGESKTRVRILRSNGVEEEYWAENGKLCQEVETEELAGATQVIEGNVPADNEWEAGQVWTPYNPAILGQIRERILRVLLARPGEWFREYGPDFTCKVCQGTGLQTLQKGKREPLKTPKPCADCGQSGSQPEADLPAFPCGYCPVVQFCWEKAGVKLVVEGEKPRWTVSREAYSASGLTFTSPPALEDAGEAEV